MNNGIKKIFTAILIFSLILSAFSLTSCERNRKYDEEEVKAAIKELLPMAAKLNVVYYGSGIKYIDNENKIGVYYEADKDHLSELGFSTVVEMKLMTERVFSDEYSEIIYSRVLNARYDEGSFSGSARYYQVYDDNSNPIRIMVNTNEIYTNEKYMIFRDKIEYDYNSLQITGSKKERVLATINVTVTNKDGNSQIKDIDIALIEENDGWKIDNPVFANYNYN